MVIEGENIIFPSTFLFSIAQGLGIGMTKDINR